MMWKQVKNWLIKRLGGYTKAEYEIVRMPHTQVKEVRRTVDLRAVRTVRFEEVKVVGQTQMEILVKKWLTQELIQSLQPYIVWRKTKYPAELDFEMQVEATLTVVDNR